MSKKDLKRVDKQQVASKKVKHHLRMRFDFQDLIEDMIQDGQDAGVFDDLPGAGKPLKLDKNVFGSEKALAHELLKSNDLPPAWISSRNLALGEIEILRTHIQKTWTRHKRAYQVAQGQAHQSALEISWDDACLRWQSDIQKINKQISDYNLRFPSDNLELFKLDLENELKRVSAPRWLKN